MVEKIYNSILQLDFSKYKRLDDIAYSFNTLKNEPAYFHIPKHGPSADYFINAEFKNDLSVILRSNGYKIKDTEIKKVLYDLAVYDNTQGRKSDFQDLIFASCKYHYTHPKYKDTPFFPIREFKFAQISTGYRIVATRICEPFSSKFLMKKNTDRFLSLIENGTQNSDIHSLLGLNMSKYEQFGNDTDQIRSSEENLTQGITYHHIRVEDGKSEDKNSRGENPSQIISVKLPYLRDLFELTKTVPTFATEHANIHEMVSTQFNNTIDIVEFFMDLMARKSVLNISDRHYVLKFIYQNDTNYQSVKNKIFDIYEIETDKSDDIAFIHEADEPTSEYYNLESLIVSMAKEKNIPLARTMVGLFEKFYKPNMPYWQFIREIYHMETTDINLLRLKNKWKKDFIDFHITNQQNKYEFRR